MAGRWLLGFILAGCGHQGTFAVRAEVTLADKSCTERQFVWDLDAQFWYGYGEGECELGKPAEIWGDDGSCWQLLADCEKSGAAKDPFFTDANGAPNPRGAACADTPCEDDADLPAGYPIGAEDP